MENGVSTDDKVEMKARKRIEEKLPYLLEDITSIVDSQSQTDPDFKTTILFTRLTSKEIRKHLIIQKNIQMMNYLLLKLSIITKREVPSTS